MQTYRLEWNLCQINGVLNFTYTSYATHMQSLIFIWKWFSVILQKNYVQLMEKWNLIKLTVSVAAVQTYFQKR